MLIINKPVFFLLLLGLFCSNRIFSQECRKDTVYLVFDSSKFAEKRIYFMSFTEGLYTRYIDDKNPSSIVFERKHKDAVGTYDTFVFDRRKYTPRKILKEEIKDMDILDFNEMETVLIKKDLYDTPQVLYPNLGIIEIRGQSATMYSPIKWERSTSIE